MASAIAVDRALAGGEERFPGNAGGIVNPRLFRARVTARGLALLGHRAAGIAEAARYSQAYRLYTLALAQQPDLGAMNRLREAPSMSTGERWLLAAAYRLANQPDAAAALVKGDRLDVVAGPGDEYTFGSQLRNRALVLQGLALMGREADAAKLVDAISGELADGEWHSTQSVAFALVSVARWAQASRGLQAQR